MKKPIDYDKNDYAIRRGHPIAPDVQERCDNPTCLRLHMFVVYENGGCGLYAWLSTHLSLELAELAAKSYESRYEEETH